MNHLGPARPGHAALLVGLLANQRRGAVRLDVRRPDDPMAPPVVDFGPLGDADTVRLAAGVEMVEELLDDRTVRRRRRRCAGRRRLRRLRPRHLDVRDGHRRRRARRSHRLRRTCSSPTRRCSRRRHRRARTSPSRTPRRAPRRCLGTALPNRRGRKPSDRQRVHRLKIVTNSARSASVCVSRHMTSDVVCCDHNLGRSWPSGSCHAVADDSVTS